MSDSLLPRSSATHEAIARYAQHPLLEGRMFYSIPGKLLEVLLRSPQLHAALDHSTLVLDQAFARDFEAHGFIGVWKRRPLTSTLLAPPPDPVADDSLLAEWGWSRQEFAQKLGAVMPKLDAAYTASRAQIGWLLTTPDFVDEHDSLFRKWCPQLQEYGFPQHADSTGGQEFVRAGGTPVTQPQDAAFAGEFLAFFQRWDLTGMVGPYLPTPIQAHWPAFPHGLSDNAYRCGAANVSLPRNVPLPEAEELRKDLEVLSSRRSAPPPMRGWYEIVKNANRNRDIQLKRYARQFFLVHFYRVLHQHYREALAGHNERLWAVFASYLNVPEDTIRSDMHQVRKNLGTTWFQDPVG